MKINSFKIFILFICYATIFTAPTDGENVVGKSAFDGLNNDAVTYGLGSNGGYTLQRPKEYKSPTIVDKLPANTLSKEKVNGVAEEKPSITNYYDGENRLNKVVVECKSIIDNFSCLHQKFCGWCSKNGTCIPGNAAGPLDTCPQAEYTFTTSRTDHPIEIRQVGGPVATTVTQQH